MRKIAVIDIGSYSVRLVIYGLDGVNPPVELRNEKVICALAHDLDKTGEMSEAALELTLQTLGRYAHIIETEGDIEAVYPLATAATRDAANGARFVQMANDVLGYPLRVLSGSCEATYAGLATLELFPCADGVSGDLGGGSLDLARLHDQTVHHAQSLPVGHLRLVDHLLDGDDVYALLHSQFEQAPWLAERATPDFYAIGGRWRDLARLFLDVKKGTPLDQAIVADDLHDFIESAIIGRKKYRENPENLPLYAGAIVMQVLIERLHPTLIYVLEHSVRDGFLLAEGLWRPTTPINH